MLVGFLVGNLVFLFGGGEYLVYLQSQSKSFTISISSDPLKRIQVVPHGAGAEVSRIGRR